MFAIFILKPKKSKNNLQAFFFIDISNLNLNKITIYLNYNNNDIHYFVKVQKYYSREHRTFIPIHIIF